MQNPAYTQLKIFAHPVAFEMGGACWLAILARPPESRFVHPLPDATSENYERGVSPKTSCREPRGFMLKNKAEPEQHTSDQERQDSMALKQRAADDARKAADSFASSIQSQDDKTAGPSGLELVEELFCPKHEQARAGSPDGMDGDLIHSVGGNASGELLETFLAAQVEALAAESMRIFRDNVSWSGKYIRWMNQVL
jgi:hypothetical protein